MIIFFPNVLAFQSVKSVGYGADRVNSYDNLVQNISRAQEVISWTLATLSSERKSESDAILALPPSKSKNPKILPSQQSAYTLQ